MEEKEKEELIKKLSESRESISLLRNMLKRDQWNVEQKLKLVNEAKRTIDGVLYELTGNEFYRNNEEDNNENKSLPQQG
jgi:hypothetical protein